MNLIHTVYKPRPCRAPESKSLKKNNINQIYRYFTLVSDNKNGLWKGIHKSYSILNMAHLIVPGNALGTIE